MMETIQGKPLQQWSDDEIREALRIHNVLSSIPPITPLTRPFLERKLASCSWLNINPGSESCGSANDSRSIEIHTDHNASSISAQTFTQPVEGYYGVVGPNSASRTTVSQLSPFYTSKSDALKAIKCIPGARFKKFESRAGAEAFSSRQLQVQEEPLEQTDSPSNDAFLSGSVNLTVDEKPNNFPSLKTPDLSNFRSMIEKGEVEPFLDCIRANPRYLITSGDAPPLLKVSVEYNALHCAVKARQLEICQRILAIVQSDEFWLMVYCDDTEEVRLLRKHHLVDLYLNRQEKGFGETPLHFACKLGHEEIVSFLMTFFLTSTTIKNKYGETPAEVVCQNGSTSTPGLKEKIKESLREPEIYYVPVFRTEDNSTPPSLGKPCTLEQLDEVEAQVDGSGLPIVGNGLAGPMSPCDAEQFYHDWKTPNDSSERKQATRVKRSDSTRGLERIGRQLAHKKEVEWEEYWEFLGCSCDLSKPEGQQLLEEFFRCKAYEGRCREHNLQGSPIQMQTNGAQNDFVVMSESPLQDWRSMTNEDVTVNKSDLSRKLFTDDSEGSIEEADVMEVTHKDEVDGLSEMVAKKLSLESNRETAVSGDTDSFKIEDDHLFIVGAFPTKLDHDVFLAFCGVEPEPSQYPNITKWLGLVRSFSENEQKSWRTPRKQQGVVNRSTLAHTPSPLPVSPLVFSSPSAPMHNYSYGNSSPLVTSGTSLNQSVHDMKSVNTSPTQHPSGQRLYWQRHSTTPRGRHTPVGIRVRSTNTTPRRHGQTIRMTPTAYGRLSFTPKI